MKLTFRHLAPIDYEKLNNVIPDLFGYDKEWAKGEAKKKGRPQDYTANGRFMRAFPNGKIVRL